MGQRVRPSRLRLFVGTGPTSPTTARMIQAAQAACGSGAGIEIFGQSTVRGADALAADDTVAAIPGPVSLDVESILARPPGPIAVIDLARDGASDGDHRYLWQDVQLLLAAGRDVFATMAVTDLAGVGGAIAWATGAGDKAGVPDAIFDSAEIEVVDIATSMEEPALSQTEAAFRSLTLRRVALAVERRASSDGVAMAPAAPDRVLVAISGAGSGEIVIRAAKRLAAALHAPWHVLHVETPRARLDATRRAADTLGRASQMGATISTVPAVDVLQGIEAHLAAFPATNLVLGGSRATGLRRLFGVSVLAEMLSRHSDAILHVVPQRGEEEGGNKGDRAPTTASAAPRGLIAAPRHYLYTIALVALTVAVAEALRVFVGLRGTNLLFLFPVIAAAARFGQGPTLVSVVASVLCFNFFLLAPAYRFDLAAPQNVVMLVVLGSVAIYTGLLTSQLRSRAALSDRNAEQSSRLALFGQSLARAATWEETAVCVCEEVGRQMKVQTVMLREKDGHLQRVAAYPADADWGAIDQAALEGCWQKGEPTGSGTRELAAGDWRFEPLKTSLGTLAVLGMVREDGREPVRADRSVLFATLVAQAALAHERLKLQDEVATRR
ncbi:DUF4118 domain-containing protein [Sphingomonas glacialis]|uniref:DUF4118 domain-containing protein n=1 Tax=Sphingomonas glacialis TaxID=658225 RepID=UPI00240CE6B5|nr:DUF4118 domain-containing protein [Sphingomonas glacialis]